jgi:hypothetical protein
MKLSDMKVGAQLRVSNERPAWTDVDVETFGKEAFKDAKELEPKLKQLLNTHWKQIKTDIEALIKPYNKDGKAYALEGQIPNYMLKPSPGAMHGPTRITIGDDFSVVFWRASK